jgi:energy-coupling factor transport system ATP-binding protein
VLTFDNVSYRYAGYATPVLHDISLTLQAGEIVGLVGANDAGKSTLCLVASGLAPGSVGGALTAGEVRVDDRPMADTPLHELATLVGIGFQNPATQLSQVAESVFEEVAFGPMNLALPRADVIARTWDALTTLRIDGLAERDPRRLSGGQQQLVAIAGLLALRPQHLVLDEPTAQLDPAGTRLVADAISRLAADGGSILVTEQKADLLAATCTRVAVLDGGRIAMAGPAETVLADERLPGLGVSEPSSVRLRRAIAAAGIDEPRVEAALADA